MTALLVIAGIITVIAGAAPIVGHVRQAGHTGALGAIPRAAVNIALCVGITAVAVPGYGHLTGQYRLLPVLSGSMEPSMAKGDAAWVEPVNLEDVRAGDVIVFTAPDTIPGPLAGQQVIHRVLEVVDPATVVSPQAGVRYIRTQGDANQSPDPWIIGLDDAQVWARTGVFPHAGTVINRITSPDIRGLLIFGAAMLFVGFGAMNIIQGLRTSPHTPTRFAPTPGRTGRRRTAAAIALIATGATATGLGAWAAFADTDATSSSVSNGVIALSLDQGVNRLTMGFEDLIPGQTVERAVDLQHIGTTPLYGAGPADPVDAIGLQLDVTNPTPGDLTNDRSDGLQVSLFTCGVPWTETTEPSGLFTYTCPGGGEVEVFGDQPLLGRRDLPRSQFDSYIPAETDHLMFRFRLPASAPAGYQDQTATVAFDFIGIQRDGINQ